MARARWSGMRLGIRLRRLWHLRAGVAACAALALVMAIWSVEKISLSPPALTPRGERAATASLRVEIDTSKSSLADLREDSGSLHTLTDRAVLLGNVMATPPVRRAIARRAGLPLDELQVNAPLTSAMPLVPARPGEMSITLRTSPTAPLLDIDSRAADTETAERLAEAAATETQAYLARVATSQRSPAKGRLRLVPLGRAEGLQLKTGVGWTTPLLVFAFVFGIACASLTLAANVRDGVRLSRQAERA